MMRELIESFPKQLTDAMSMAQDVEVFSDMGKISNVYVAGIGGSAISGDIVREMVKDHLDVPYVVGRSYSVPKWVGSETLVFVNSYSGNTEETLCALEEIKRRDAYIVCVSSGGKLAEQESASKLINIKLPKNGPIPRANIGYPMAHILMVLRKCGLIDDTVINNFYSSIDQIKYNQDHITHQAQIVADEIQGRVPIIYTTDKMESVAVRFRQQLNENSKQLCWHHSIPEMNHNELVGWSKKYPKTAVIYLRNSDDYKRNSIRIDINKDIIKECTDTIIELDSKGNSLTEKMVYFIHLSDWVSLFLAERNGVNPVAIEVIDHLKSELSKV